MPLLRTNGIELEVEEQGEGLPLLLIMGVGAQLVYWPDGFCEALVARGLRVIRFDHRDIGRSTKLDDVPPLRFRRLIARWLLGLPLETPYTLIDMADDVAGLLDALGLERAHVVGISMGGMIAQIMAIRHGARLRSMTVMSSHSGERRWFFGSPRATGALIGRAPRNREEALDRAVTFYRAVGSTAYPFDEALIRDRAGRSHDRCFYPPGFSRHVAAILATGSRAQALRFVRVPTLITHGTVDPLIRPAAGRALAAAIPGAALRLVDGLGHELPKGAWPLLADAIADHVRAAESSPA